jgi:hypothetical protein
MVDTNDALVFTVSDSMLEALDDASDFPHSVCYSYAKDGNNLINEKFEFQVDENGDMI